MGFFIYSFGEWIEFIEQFNVKIETNTESKIRLNCKVDADYPLSVASPELST